MNWFARRRKQKLFHEKARKILWRAIQEGLDEGLDFEHVEFRDLDYQEKLVLWMQIGLLANKIKRKML